MTTNTTTNTGGAHESVLLHEAITGLALKKNDIVVDATIGGAGHFSAFLRELGKEGVLVGIDADADAVARGSEAAKESEATVHLVEDNFRNYNTILDSLAITAPTKSLFDLGWSGYQLHDGRGLSFIGSEPLFMTYSKVNEGGTAADAVNGLSEAELAHLLYTLGEETFSRHIARGIVEARAQSRILTTDALVAIIMKSTPSWYHTRRIHPATKTFQALRMHVNDELGALAQGLSAALSRTAPFGRIAVISFHSIEDRVVKNIFRDAAREGKGVLVNKKPITPSLEERKTNPRARSAKLRIFQCGNQPYAYV